MQSGSNNTQTNIIVGTIEQALALGQTLNQAAIRGLKKANLPLTTKNVANAKRVYKRNAKGQFVKKA